MCDIVRPILHERLYKLINPLKSTTSSVFVFGPPNCGKSYLVHSVIDNIKKSLNKDKNAFIKVDCSEALALDKDGSVIFDKIIYHLMDVYGVSYKVTNVRDGNDFVLKLDRIVSHTGLTSICIVLDSVESFKNNNLSNIPSVFARLNEYLQLEKSDIFVTCVFISSIPSYKIFGDLADLEMIDIYVPGFTQAEVEKILLDESSLGSELLCYYKTYVTLFVGTLIKICVDVSELRYIVQKNWSNYLIALQKENYNHDKLKDTFKSLFESSLESIYTRHSNDSTPSADKTMTRGCIELPSDCRWLLVAAYIASYNSKKCDDMFLPKNDKMSKRQKNDAVRREKTRNRFTGPKYFTLDRLFAIYFSLIGGCYVQTVATARLIRNLLDIKLLETSSTAKDDALKYRKYRCVASFELVDYIAKEIQVNLSQYLTDLT